MELGEKIRQARLEAGLSQRQLCGDEITRNMLSLIENGSAKPSMKTLQYLAARLGKSVSYFLEENVSLSPNQSVMETIRRLYDAGEYREAALALEAYQAPDAAFDREWNLLYVLIHLELARWAIDQRRTLYARELLQKADRPVPYCQEELLRRRLLLTARLKAQRVSALLPSLDEELLLRAQEALEEGRAQRAGRLLDAAEDRDSVRWQLLRGNTCLMEKDYKTAADWFHRAERDAPAETAGRLELCYRELGDFKKAYEYACKQR